MSKKSKSDNLFDLNLIDKLIKGKTTRKKLFGKDGIVKQFQKAFLERILEGEMTTEIGYDKTVIIKKS